MPLEHHPVFRYHVQKVTKRGEAPAPRVGQVWATETHDVMVTGVWYHTDGAWDRVAWSDGRASDSEPHDWTYAWPRLGYHLVHGPFSPWSPPVDGPAPPETP